MWNLTTDLTRVKVSSIYIWGNSPNKILCKYTEAYRHTYVYIHAHCKIFQEKNVWLFRKIKLLRVLLLPNSTQVQMSYLRTATNIVSVRKCLGFPTSLPFPHARFHNCEVNSRYLFVCASKMTALNERQNFIVFYCKLHGEGKQEIIASMFQLCMSEAEKDMQVGRDE